MAAEDDEDGGATATASSSDSATVPIGTTQAPAEAPAAAPSGPDFTSLVKAPGEMAGLQKQLADIQRAKSATNAANADEATKRLDVDRARMEAAYKASATMPDELKQGWDAKAKTAEHSTDPVTAFGSLGSVFAMLASSFAGLPMEAGLNAGAAAINAVHAGDEKAYNRDYQSWKDNTELALKRHNIQHQTYNDATNLMNSNINAGRTKMELAATKYGDQKVEALLDAGMDKELFTLINDRNKAALETQSQWDKVNLEHTKVMDLKADPRFADPATKAQAIADWTQRWSGAAKAKYDTVQQLQRAWDNENPQSGYEERKAAFIDIEKSVAEAQDTGTSGASGPLSGPKARQVEVDRRKAEYIAGGMSETEAYNKAANEVANAQVAMPSAQRGKYQDRVFVADQTLQTIDKQLDRLEKYVGITGTAGYVRRGGEKVANIAGSSDVERQEFQKDIELMRLNAGRMLTLSQGRPLAAEANRINTIIKGTGFGDLNTPTIAAMRDYKKFVEDFKRDAASRLPGGSNPEGIGTGGGSTSSPPKKAAPSWRDAPIVKPAAGPRAGIDSDVAYG